VLPGQRFGRNGMGIANPTAAVLWAVTVHDLGIPTIQRQAYPVAQTRHRGEVADDYEGIRGGGAAPHKADDRVVGVADVNPFKALPAVVNRVERGLRSIEMVEVHHIALEPL